MATVIAHERPQYANWMLANERKIFVELFDDAEQKGEFTISEKETTAEMIQSATMKFRYPQLWSKLTLPKLERELGWRVEAAHRWPLRDQARADRDRSRRMIPWPSFCAAPLPLAVLVGLTIPSVTSLSLAQSGTLKRGGARRSRARQPGAECHPHHGREVLCRSDRKGRSTRAGSLSKKPGRMRFEYAAPNPTLIVSDGRWVAVENRQAEHRRSLRAVDHAAESYSWRRRRPAEQCRHRSVEHRGDELVRHRA